MASTAAPCQKGGTSAAGGADAARPARRNRANNNLLRNYYGLDEAASGSSGDDSGRAGDAASSSGMGPAASQPAADPRDPDSGSAFDVDAAFRSRLQTKTLAQLLREESVLLTEIRELDGERQSLVYNHHHELVFASETMRRMKERADALMPSLASLQSSMQEIARTSDTLHDPASIDELSARGGNEASAAMAPSETALLAKVAPVIELPQRLRDIIALGGGKGDSGSDQSLAKAQSLWGSMEAVLAAWDEAGMSGAREIMSECRLVLRESQQSALAVS